MPSLPPYNYTGPLDLTILPSPSVLRSKSVLVTGGANGIGEFYVRAVHAAGAFVTFGDVNAARGQALASELGKGAQFVRCDIRNWDEQVALFEAAKKNSPRRSCDIVIANAGISRAFADSLWLLDDENAPPVKPDLEIVDVNMVGTLYTFKLAVHYFRAQPDDEERDRCFLIQGSLSQYVDQPGNWEYTCTKYGLRGLLRTTRRNTWQQGIRVNLIAPYFIKSAIRTDAQEAALIAKGAEFAPPEDCVKAMMRIACDRSVHGHSLNVVPTTVAAEGFLDAEMDDHQGAPSYYKHMQSASLAIGDKLWTRGNLITA